MQVEGLLVWVDGRLLRLWGGLAGQNVAHLVNPGGDGAKARFCPFFGRVLVGKVDKGR